ncbi:MAG TPA: hypothetical protein VK509_12265 [Polyangiales bacterium]|nr:hypothetical protein [Polyangiales bacterium]
MLRTIALALAVIVACGDDDDADERGTAGMTAAESEDAGTGGEDFDPQRPPTDTKRVEAWLARGFYKDWVCEDEPTAKTDGAPAIHAHGGKSFVCTNALLAQTERKGGEEYPEGVASVKEILDSAGKLTLTAVAVKIAAKSGGGKGWYWYEGARYSGVGVSTCTGCHSAAGADPDHPGAGDYVYFRNDE